MLGAPTTIRTITKVGGVRRYFTVFVAISTSLPKHALLLYALPATTIMPS